jgi:3-methyl-2-oxobutanoate hydroxymethyltransferase
MASTLPPFDRLPENRRITSLTAYDYPTARLLDEAGIDLILVGDSLGMVVAGLPDTTGVTMEQMLYHAEIVARAVKQALLVVDLPFHSYETPEQAVENAQRLIATGADAVKLEGGRIVLPQIRAIIEAGIPFVGHLGMLPQSVKEEGGYKKKGKTEAGAQRLIDEARLLEEAGTGAIVLESIVPEVAREVTNSVRIPTIGIGTGPVDTTTGQIRVLHDVIGAYPWFVPPFATPHADIAGAIRRAVAAYVDEVNA